MKYRILAFIFLSMLVHIILFASYKTWNPFIAVKKEQGSSFVEVELLTETSHKENTPLKKTHKPKLIEHLNNKSKRKKTHSATPDLDRHKKNSLKNLQANKDKHKSTQNVTNTRLKNKIDLQKLNGLLKSEFNHNFYYPKSAIRKNWQGDVILSFIIQIDGNISDIQIKKSSGYKILDNAAISSAKQINLKAQLNEHIIDKPLPHTLPISYRLIDRDAS